MADDPGSVAVFFGLDDGAVGQLHESDVMQKVRTSLAKAPDAVRNFATESVADALKSALNVPLIDLFAAAWKTIHELRKYCDQSKYPPGEVNNYALAEHVISSTHRPRFRVVLDGTPCGPEIEFDVDLKVTIEAVSLEILDARIMKAATGSIQGSGSISCAGATLVERETSAIDIPGKYSFGEGILIGPPYRSDPSPASA
jgi:hypothetical protein